MHSNALKKNSTSLPKFYQNRMIVEDNFELGLISVKSTVASATKFSTYKRKISSRKPFFEVNYVTAIFLTNMVWKISFLLFSQLEGLFFAEVNYFKAIFLPIYDQRF